jgi:hypothetical protein
MKTTILKSLLLAALVIFSACGESKKKSGEDPIPKVEKALAEDSTGFPIPYPEKGELITDNWDSQTGNITLEYESRRYEEVIGFYDNYTSGDSWKRSGNGQGERSSITYINLGTGQTISIGPPNGQVLDAFLVSLFDSL